MLAKAKAKQDGGVTVEHALEKYVDRPTIAWNLLESSQVVERLKLNDIRSPKPPGHTRFVCISDTHNRTDRMEHAIPDGDILIHAGDFTSCGTRDQVIHFNRFLGTLNHPHKVVIAGNHDISFDLKSYDSLWSNFTQIREEPEETRKQLTNCIYLEDEEITVRGFRIYGSPWWDTEAWVKRGVEHISGEAWYKPVLKTFFKFQTQVFVTQVSIKC